MEALVERFHNLGGATVSEHKRNFNIYLKELKSSDVQPQAVLTAIQPKTRQEEIFVVKLLVEFNQQHELLKLLTLGDRIICKVILRHAQLQPTFAAMSPKYFIETICPELSYVTRIAVINNYLSSLRDVKIAQDYFTEVRRTYGIRTATPILVACTEEFILKTLQKNQIKFTQRALIKLHKTYPGFLQTYFKTYTHKFSNYTMLAQYLSTRDIRTFHELLQHGTPSIGKRGFTNFLKNYKNDVITNPDKHSFTKPKILIHMISREDFHIFFQHLLPESIDSFSFTDSLYTYLQLLPVADRCRFFCETFKNRYEFDVITSEVVITERFLEILPVDDRMKFKAIEEHVELLAVDTAIDALKNRINLTSDINIRAQLARSLVKTCKVNNDTGALLKVLEYFIKRHKNDNQEIRAAFVDTLYNSFELEKLGAEYWKVINELVLIFEVNDECYYNKNDLMEKFLLYLLLNGLDYVETLKKLYKLNGPNKINMLNGHPTFAKMCLLRYPESIDEIYKDSTENLRARAMFISAISTWNTSHRKDTISFYVYPDFINIILNVKRDDPYRYYYRSVVKDIVLYKPLDVAQKVYRQELLEKYLLSDGDVYLYDEVADWMIKSRPDLIEKYPKLFVSKACKQYELSKMHYLKVYRVLKDVSLKILDDPNSESGDICGALSILAYDDDFLNYIVKYKPSDDCVIDPNDDIIAKTLKIQKRILKLLKCISKTEIAIETVLHYCKKDYLRYALEPLYFTLYHAREKSIQSPIDILLSRAVSVRKHTVYLGTILGTTQSIYNVLKKTGENETNRSVKKFIFTRTYKCFIMGPCDDYYQLLVKHLNLLDLADRESMCILLNLKNVPILYFADFMQIIWTHMQRYDGNKEFELINRLNPELIKKLSPEFCKEVIQHCLFNENNCNGDKMIDFIQAYLLCDDSELQPRITFIIGLINDYAGGDGDYLNQGKKVAKIYEIFENICVVLMEKPKQRDSIQLINALINSLPGLKLPCDKFEFELLVNYTKFFIAIQTDHIRAICGYFCKQLRELIAKNGAEISMLYRSFVEVALERTFKVLKIDRPESYLAVIEALLQTDDNTHTRILCIRLLPKSKSKDPRKANQLQAAIGKIREGCSPVVHVFILRYLCTM